MKWTIRRASVNDAQGMIDISNVAVHPETQVVVGFQAIEPFVREPANKSSHLSVWIKAARFMTRDAT